MIALFLTGGLSTRMGQPKLYLPIEQTTLLQWSMHQAIASGFEVTLTTNTCAPHINQSILPEHQLISDQLPNSKGPLSGIAAGLTHYSEPEQWILVTSCDHVIPFYWIQQQDPSQQDTNADMILFQCDNQVYPVLGFYKTSLWKSCLQTLQTTHTLFQFVQKHKWDTREIPQYWKPLVNFNTAEEYQHALFTFNTLRRGNNGQCQPEKNWVSPSHSQSSDCISSRSLYTSEAT